MRSPSSKASRQDDSSDSAAGASAAAASSSLRHRSATLRSRSYLLRRIGVRDRARGFAATPRAAQSKAIRTLPPWVAGRHLTALLVSAVALWPALVRADGFYARDFDLTLPAALAKAPSRSAAVVGGLAAVQIGTRYLVGLNVESKFERWRFVSKAGAIRSVTYRGATALIEAEHLVSLDLASGKQRWQVPLNCYAPDRCNTRVRAIGSDVLVLSGFDGKDDQLMLVDVDHGHRLWPNWVPVGGAAHLRFANDTIVVATRDAPYAVLGLDRTTGRVRWRLRPEGTESGAGGLLIVGDRVVTWWSSRSADTVYTVDLQSGAPKADWLVTRRARGRTVRGGTPGTFFAYQPSLVGSGGTLRVWSTETGQRLWSRTVNVAVPPFSRGSLLYLVERPARGLSLAGIDPRTGKDRWRYVRGGATRHRLVFDGALAALALDGSVPALLVLNALDGRIEGAGPLGVPLDDVTGLRLGGRDVFVLAGRHVARLQPTPMERLMMDFEERTARGDTAGARAIYDRVRPFADELPTAARIHRKVASHTYKDITSRMKSGTFFEILPVVVRLASDANLTSYFEDFRGFVVHVEELLASRSTAGQPSAEQRRLLGELVARMTVLASAFDVKLRVESDAAANKALVRVVRRLGGLLAAAGDPEAALRALVDLFRRPWAVPSDDFRAQVIRLVRGQLQRHLPAYRRAVEKRSGMDIALDRILAVPGIGILVPGLPTRAAIVDLTAAQHGGILQRLRTAASTDR